MSVAIPNLRDRVVLVTGAASGIGRETALAFASRGARLVLADLDESGLAKTAADVPTRGGALLRADRVDVADREAMRAFAERVHRDVEAIDVLVNNAGVGLGGPFADTDLASWDWIVSINLMGVVHGCHFFLPPMRAKRRGFVLNIASLAGLVGTPMMSAYTTTKFAVVGLSRSLEGECAQDDVGVAAICPGVINTPITRNARMVGPREEVEAARDRGIAMFQRRGYGPERVGAAMVEAVVRGRTGVVPVSPESHFFWRIERLAPWFTGWIARRPNPLFGGAASQSR